MNFGVLIPIVAIIGDGLGRRHPDLDYKQRRRPRGQAHDEAASTGQAG